MYSYYCCNHPLRESHEWPKHVGGHYVIQLHSLKQREFVCFFLNKFYASNMKLKLIYYILMNRNKKLSSKIKYFILFYFILFYFILLYFIYAWLLPTFPPKMRLPLSK